MSDSDFDVKVYNEHGSHYLSTTRNGYQWTAMMIESADQMRKVAAVLLAKADEIDGTEKNMDALLAEVRRVGLKELGSAIIKNWFDEEIKLNE